MKFIEDSTGIKMAKYSDIEGYSFNNDTKEYLKLSRIEDIDNQFEDSIFQNFKYAFNENGENEQSYIYQFKLALKMKVKSEKYNGKECYAISYKNADGYILTLYIDKKELVKVAEKVDNEDSIVYEWNFNIQNENNYNKENLLNEYTSIN